MVVHIVMLKFKDENKKENLERIKQMLESLVEKIEPLLSMEVGIDFMQSERSFDLVLISTFKDKEGLSVYATHPEHINVINVIKQATVISKVVDYVK